jgi:YegS/Rv2252/BmrU family lipid kinase
MLPLIITNPKSAGGDTEEKWASIASDFATHFGAFDVAFTTHKGHAVEIARREATQGRKLIIACGGDGTINEVANGILQSGFEAELGIIPSGTGGDFRRTLKIPINARDAAQALKKGQTEKIDVGRVTFIGHDNKEETRYFLGVSSFGLAGEVIERAKKDEEKLYEKILPTKAAYTVATLQSKLASPNKTVLVQIDDKSELCLTVTNLCVANAKYFGGGMFVAPDAKLNDGKFDVVSIGDLSTADVLLNGYKLFLGSHLSIEQVNHTLAKKITASPMNKDDEIKLEVDGELPGRLPATFEIIPKALSVRVKA